MVKFNHDIDVNTNDPARNICYHWYHQHPEQSLVNEHLSMLSEPSDIISWTHSLLYFMNCETN